MGYLFAAYSIIFIAIFLYVTFIWRRQSSLEDEVRAIESRLNDLRIREATPPQSSAQP